MYIDAKTCHPIGDYKGNFLLLEVQLPYDPSCPSVGSMVDHCWLVGLLHYRLFPSRRSVTISEKLHFHAPIRALVH